MRNVTKLKQDNSLPVQMLVFHRLENKGDSKTEDNKNVRKGSLRVPENDKVAGNFT